MQLFDNVPVPLGFNQNGIIFLTKGTRTETFTVEITQQIITIFFSKKLTNKKERKFDFHVRYHVRKSSVN